MFKKVQKFTGRVQINLQPRVTVNLDCLQQEHIENLSSRSNEHFKPPTVITVKKDQSIKLALISKV